MKSVATIKIEVNENNEILLTEQGEKGTVALEFAEAIIQEVEIKFKSLGAVVFPNAENN